MLGKFFCILLLVAGLVAGEQELRLIHVLFVHPTEYSVPAYLAVANTVEDLSEKDLAANIAIAEIMTKEEKLVTYNLGVRLRQKYGRFLGDVYTSRITRTQTTDADVSIMAASLVDAGLWPPSKEQQWLEDFLWQPIPTEYVPRNVDVLMMGRLCPTFVEATNIVRSSANFLKMEEKHRELFSRISEETGMGMSSSRDIAYLYKSLKARASRNLTLPSWTEGIFPNGEMLDVTYLEDEVLSKTTIQRKLNGGFLIQKILLDSMAHINGLLDNERKIMVYSGDSDLLIGLMHSLGVWHPHVPNVASALIFELLQDTVSQTYKMKISYDLGKDNVTIPLKIPGCGRGLNSTGCRFENLVLLLAEILPGSDQTLCGQTITEIFFKEERLSVEMNLNSAASSTTGVLAIFCFTILTIVL